MISEHKLASASRFDPRDLLRGSVLILLAAGQLATLNCDAGFVAPCTTQHPCVYAKPGQTIKELIESLPNTGGVLYLGVGAWSSGYNDYSSVISKPNVAIQGSGMATYNSTYTALTGGTIVQGPILASSGADHFTVRDLGIDAGPSYIDANNKGVPTDGLAIFNVGQVVGAPPVESPLIENVSCLGYSTMALVHCMLVENVNHAYVHNVMTVMNTHGLAFKGTNSLIDGLFARGHAADGLIIKNDIYASSANIQVSNINIQSLFSPTDTRGMRLQSIGGSLASINIAHVHEQNVFTGVFVQGTSALARSNGLTFSDINIGYDAGTVATTNGCFKFTGYVQQVSISSLNCFNMGYGIVPLTPSASFTNFTIADSKFTNMATNAIQTYGAWTIRNSTFAGIGQNAIFNPFGVTIVFQNTFSNVDGSDMLSGGGSFVESSNESDQVKPLSRD